jgi:hypothetical protein
MYPLKTGSMTMNRRTKIGDAMRHFFHAGIFAVILGVAMSGGAARADDVAVTAAVSDDQADVGQSVDFTITVNGATDASVPQNIDVDGLTLTYEGPNSQTQISFSTGFGGGSHIQRSVVHTYSVVPQRGGDFVIPPQQVTVDGKNYTTQRVNLKVGGGGSASTGGGGGGGSASGGGGGAGSANGTNSDGSNKLYYAELVLPRNTAYIGEALPFEIRLYVDARVRAQLEEMPEIIAEGCTVQKTTKPDQSEVTRNGQEYVMVTYKSAVTPAKTGELKLGPVTVQAEAQLPQRRPRRSGGPFDDPFFQNPFFDDAFQRMMSPPQQISIKGEPVALSVLPLPAAGQPRSFAGAVGNFSMTTSVKPSMVESGDPITVTAKIMGRGDFDRVTAPQITDPDGWRTYPPSAKFEGDDDVGISGTKTFEMAVIPQTKKTASPALEWSYFDPIKEQYVTLTEKGWPIKIEGDVQASATPAVAVARQTPPPNQGTPGILYIRADSTGWGETFAPLYTNRLFWEAQGAPLLALLAFVGLGVARKRAADERARLHAQLRKEKETAMDAIRRRDVPEGELYQAAARALRLEAAIQTGRTPDTLDGSEVAKARALDAALAERVRRVFDRQAEVLYAGTSGGRRAASLDERTNVLETVKGYEDAKPA